jgi:probable addiction module antidote protein
MANKTSSYRESLLAALVDTAEASAYLNAALEESQESFLKALKNVAQAHQMSKVAKEAGIQRETLYRSFSEQGNPTFETLSSVLDALGMRLMVAANSNAESSLREAAELKVHSSRA